jgi:hypothetical protein
MRLKLQTMVPTTMKELFKALEMSDDNDKNLARKLQLERIILKQKQSIAHYLTLSGDEWTEHDQQSLESMTEGLRSYVAQLNYLKK